MTHTLPTLEFLPRSRGSLVLGKTWKAVWRTLLLLELQVALENTEKQQNWVVCHTPALAGAASLASCLQHLWGLQFFLVFTALVMCWDASPSSRQPPGKLALHQPLVKVQGSACEVRKGSWETGECNARWVKELLLTHFLVITSGIWSSMPHQAEHPGSMLPKAKPQFPDVGWEGQVTGGIKCQNPC